ncbi:MAG: hypothetical protein AAGK23_09880 [Pseudomonadota bacterium]
MSLVDVGSLLKRPRTLWILGLTYLGLTICFGIVITIYDLSIIDETADPEAVRSLLAAMTAEQRRAHFWMTLILDMPYPLAYGGFYVGLALRFFGRWGPMLAIPACLAIPADLVENTVQLFVLAGMENLLWIKSIATPVKLIGFVIASLIALAALGLALVRKFN